MRRVLHYGVTRWISRALVLLCLGMWHTPPGWAFQKPPRPRRTQTPDAEHRRDIEARRTRGNEEIGKWGNWETRKLGNGGMGKWGNGDRSRGAGERELTAREMRDIYGRGPYRNRYFSGVLPWQRSLRDVNLSNGNLFKSFTDIQVPPARGAGLAWQRSYNSSDDRIGPFGVGWTTPYDIYFAEANPDDKGNDNQTLGLDKATRTDFFGGKHAYKRDADGLYSPPPYLFDELSSEYGDFLENGPQAVLADEEHGMDGTVKHFVTVGTERRCDYIQDRHGNQTLLEYSHPSGDPRLLTKVTDPSGRYLEISWTNFGSQEQPIWRIAQVRGPFDGGQPVYTVSYEYNAQQNLWKVHQDPAGLNRVTTFTYTTVGPEWALLASVSDSLGHTVSYQYTLEDQVTNTVWVTQVTEPGSGGDLIWRITPALDLSNGVAIFTWCGSNVTNYAAQVGVRSDDHLRATTTYYPTVLGIAYQTEYDSANNVTRKAERMLWYDPGSPNYNHNIQRATVATYGPHGNVVTQSVEGFPGETTTTSYYNASKYFQKESVTDALGNVTRMDYFDKFDPNPGNRGNVKWVRDARYATTGKQFEYAYNQYGQKTEEKNLNDVFTDFFYEDSWGNLTKVVQDPGQGHLNRITQMVYDVAGRVVSSQDPKGQTGSFVFNGVGQPLTATFPDEQVSYSYGANGRTEAVTDNRGATQIQYEAGNDRVAQVIDPVTGAVGYTYSVDGRRLTMSLPGGGVWNYAYSGPLLPKDEPDSATFALAQITDDQGRIVDYVQDTQGGMHEARFDQTFDAGGGVTSYARAYYTLDASTDGSRTHRYLAQIRNSWHWKNQNNQWQSRTLVQNDYSYSLIGNRLTNQISDQNGPVRTEGYGYDGISRLTSVDYGDGETQGYSFDPMGNRLSKTDNGVSEGYAYNAANMLTQRASQPYVNDANGNTLTGGGRVSTWDSQNRMTQCVFGPNTSSFVYGADGLRRRSTVNATVTDYVLDGQSAIRTLQSGALAETFLTGPRGPEYQRAGNNTAVWYLYDGLGSVLGTVDTNGNIISTRKFDVYGAVRDSTGPSGTKHKFCGALGHPSEDETGLIYMRARFMDPVTGRFVSEDPAQDGANWYGYTTNNPVDRVDPSGKEDVWHFILSMLGEGVFMLGILAFIIGMVKVLAAPGVAFLAVAGGWAAVGVILGLVLMALGAVLYLVGTLGELNGIAQPIRNAGGGLNSILAVYAFEQVMCLAIMEDA
jgi:RHS repeat-associated protein